MGGGQWQYIGTFGFVGASNPKVTLKASLTGSVAADALTFVRGSDNSIDYVVADQLGQPQKLLDQARAVTWDRVTTPFGETVSFTNSPGIDQALRLPGQQADIGTGLFYNYFRDYDPSLGRYVQSDPIGLAGGVNTYAYVGSNPTERVDRFGLQSVAPTAPGAGPIGILPSLVGPGTPLGDMLSGSIKDAIQKAQEDQNDCPCEKTYRGDNNVTMIEAFTQGIKPKGTNDDLESHAIGYAGDSAYVPASKFLYIAELYAGPFGQVFVICSDRGKDVNKELGDLSPNPWDHEIAYPGGIYSSEIMGMYEGMFYTPNPRGGW